MAQPAPQIDQHQAFYEDLAPYALKPLWTVLRQTLTAQPVRRELPTAWRWQDVRPRLLRAGQLVSAQEAERRVLMFVNPGHPQAIGSTATLYAAMQLILPGETAPAHRHTPTALRFVIEGRGGYTCVEGSRIEMHVGDLVLTPSGVWHEHGNDGDGPVIWMDGLDIPLLLALNCMFFEGRGEGQRLQTAVEPTGARERLWGRALFPGETGGVRPRTESHSPVWAYRWNDVAEGLSALAALRPLDPYDGYLLRYVNPASGGEVMPSIGCRAQRLPTGTRTRAQRTTASAVYHVVAGAGESVIDGQRVTWQRGDTFAVPLWCWCEHAASEETFLFSFTDAPLIETLGLARREVFADSDGHQRVLATL